MGHVFVVDTKNLKKCLEYSLLGVPNSARAYSQILTVHEGEKLFLYEYGAKKLHGIFRATSNPFTEIEPRRGPWTGRKRDEERGWYPHRVEIDIDEYYGNPIPISEIEEEGIGIDRHSFNGKSCLYITEYQEKKIIEKLKERTRENCPVPISRRWNSRKVPPNVAELPGSKEEKLQLLVQQNLEKLKEEGLEIRFLDTYYNLTECTSCRMKGSLDFAGQIDILGIDDQWRCTIFELKAEPITRSVVGQLESYRNVLSEMIRRGIMDSQNTDIQLAVICPYFRGSLLRDLESHQIVTIAYESDFVSFIDFERLV